MTNRYITDGEKAGHQRRMENYRARLAKAGIRPRQMLLTDAEAARVRGIVACWRGEDCELAREERQAADVLKPV